MAFIAGNWKMHMGPAEADNFFCALKIDELMDNHEIVIFPPALSLFSASESRGRDERIQLGIQNIHWEDEGAFTGEISALMAVHAGAKYVLIGHSERRHLFGETDEQGLSVLQKIMSLYEEDKNSPYGGGPTREILIRSVSIEIDNN